MRNRGPAMTLNVEGARLIPKLGVNVGALTTLHLYYKQPQASDLLYKIQQCIGWPFFKGATETVQESYLFEILGRHSG